MSSNFHLILRPEFGSWIKTSSRLLRTSLKIGKGLFRLTIDVHDFRKDEIRIKACADHIKIEGKQEKTSDNGYVVRQFVKRYRLPTGCDPKQMKAVLCPNGALTITAVRQTCEPDFPCETLVPIDHGSNPKGVVSVQEESPKTLDITANQQNPCDKKGCS